MKAVARISYAVEPAARTEVPAQGRIIDLVHLARQTLGDRGLEQEVLRIFADATQAYRAGIINAASAEELKINLHSLKGASAGVGANFVAEAARAAEAELRETGGVCDETRSDLAITVEEVNTYIVELLKS